MLAVFDLYTQSTSARYLARRLHASLPRITLIELPLEPNAVMNKLSLFDQLFYKAEKAGLPPIYMCGVMILDPKQSPYPMNANTVANHLAARMERIPLMRKKVVQDSLRIGSVRLVDDPKFDVRNHVSISMLPKPGGYREFTQRLGEFSEQRIDLDRPPWHHEVIDGLAGGRIAVAMHFHHCVMDGLGAQDALTSIYDAKPVKPEVPTNAAWRVEEEPTEMSLLSEALRENVNRAFVKTPQFLRKSGLPLAKSLAAALTRQLKLKAPPAEVAPRLPKVRKTSLNSGASSFERVVSYIELPIADALAIRKHFECSINDLALVLNSAALEHYFRKIKELIDFDLVTVMPMNARKEGEKGHGNILTVAMVNLHNTIPDLATRLRTIAEDTVRIKAARRASKGSSIDSRSVMELLSPLVVDSLCFAVAGLNLMSRVNLANVAITNVPGSPVTLYVSGAPVVSAVPMAPVLGGGMAMTITVSSTDKYLLFGYHGDGAMISDKELFVEGARRAFESLRRSISTSTATVATAARGRSRKPRAKTAAKAPARRATGAARKSA
jgi:diacylglycerol O-acyltransferase / wax synthase